MKLCNGCKETKPIDAFYVVSKRGQPTTYHICKQCSKQKNQEYKEYYRDRELQKKYGITLEEYKKQTLLRGYCCDICDKEVKALHVDHNHRTGAVRGYLCGSCNRALGLLQDSAQIAFNASLYLKEND